MTAESLDPVVVGALIRLRDCNTVPPMHQTDIKKVGLTFRRLVKSGIDYHPDLVTEWLQNDGWMEAWVKKVSDIADYEQITAKERDYLERTIGNWREIGLNADNE